jgi:hypothetical protein
MSYHRSKKTVETTYLGLYPETMSQSKPFVFLKAFSQVFLSQQQKAD